MEKLKPYLVILATIGMIAMNWIATTGYIGGITPEIISNRYPTFLTPAGYAFSIWGWIYLGIIIFSIYQAIPSKLEKFAGIRTIYIASCLLNCLWLYFWHNEQIFISTLVIFSLLASLAFLNIKLERENNLFSRMVFGTYFGWVTAASIVNTAITLVSNGYQTTDGTGRWIATGLIIAVSIVGVLVRHALPNIMYAVAVAWAVTAIAVKQSGKTEIVVAAALCVVVLLFSAFSFVLKDYQPNEQR